MLRFRELGKRHGATKFQGDLYPGQTFEDIYDDIFAPFRFHGPLKLLEIGIQGGGSLKTWRDYFDYGTIVGIDNDESTLYQDDRIYTFLMDQADAEAMKKLIADWGPFDIVVDDGGHHSTAQMVSFALLFPHTNYIYCIEDLDTSYPEMFPAFSEKGKDTIVMFLKRIVDDAVLGRTDVERIDFRKRFVAIYKKGKQ